MAEQKRKQVKEDITDVAIEMPKMDIGAVPAVGKFEVPKFDEVEQTKEDDSSFSDQEKAAFARGISGATPALMGLLFGASPATAENQIKEAQKYYVAGTPSKTVLTKGPGGEPIYTDIRESIGKEAYIKPSPYGRDKQFAAVLLKNPEGKTIMGFQKGTHFYDADDNLIPSDYVRFVPDKTTSHPTASGGKVTYRLNSLTGNIEKVISTAGPGDIMGAKDKPLLKEEAQARIAGAKKGQEVVAKHEQDIYSLDEAIRELSTTKDPMVFATALGKTQRTAVGENRLSDIEGARYMGNDYKDMLTKGSEWFTSRGLGEIPDSIRKNAINLAKYAKQKALANKEGTRKAFSGTEGLSERGKKIIQHTIGVEPKPEVQSDWKNKFRK